jgi:disks large-associated protein 5
MRHCKTLFQKRPISSQGQRKLLSDERKLMLQKHKEEKQLKKLKEQKEKAKQGVFKTSVYRPIHLAFF